LWPSLTWYGVAGREFTRRDAHKRQVVNFVAAPLMSMFGVTGANVVKHLFGVVLGALAVQYMIDGIRSSFLMG
jgi:hypothetical protein